MGGRGGEVNREEGRGGEGGRERRGGGEGGGGRERETQTGGQTDRQTVSQSVSLSVNTHLVARGGSRFGRGDPSGISSVFMVS